MEKPSRFWVPACTYWQSLEMFYRRHKSLAQYCKPFFTILQHYIHVSRSCSFSSEEECESKCKDAKKDPNKNKEEAVSQGKFSKVILYVRRKRDKACMMSLEKATTDFFSFWPPPLTREGFPKDIASFLLVDSPRVSYFM